MFFVNFATKWYLKKNNLPKKRLQKKRKQNDSNTYNSVSLKMLKNCPGFLKNILEEILLRTFLT